MPGLSRGFARVAFAMVVQAATAQTPSWQAPRLADGHPDLQGDWTNTSLTLLERSDPSLALKPSPSEVKRLEADRAEIYAGAGARPDPAEGAPPRGENPGGVNLYWADRSDRLAIVRGEARSSWISDPPDGKMPISPEGAKRIAAILAKRSDAGPEGMNPADRRLIGSRGSGGPPMLNNLYNNTHQVVQTPGAVVIDVEMMHDARIIRMNSPARPEGLRQWLGDSVGRWEGETLVVVTRGWKQLQGDYGPVYLSEQATVTERSTRTAKDELFYQFAVIDPAFYSQPWSGEMTFYPANGPVYEYACHEGNYALEHILAGARNQERGSNGG